jgi:hypothetical protein
MNLTEVDSECLTFEVLDHEPNEKCGRVSLGCEKEATRVGVFTTCVVCGKAKIPYCEEHALGIMAQAKGNPWFYHLAHKCPGRHKFVRMEPRS